MAVAGDQRFTKPAISLTAVSSVSLRFSEADMYLEFWRSRGHNDVVLPVTAPQLTIGRKYLCRY